MSLSKIELVWVRVWVVWECFWVNLREDNKVSESKMAVSESNMAKSFRWLPSSSWVRMNEWSFFMKNSWIQGGRIQDGWHHQVEWQWMSEVFLVQNGWIQDGRIQDGCHHQVRMNVWVRWMSLSQIDLVWVRVRCGVRVFLSEQSWVWEEEQGVWIQDGSGWIPSSWQNSRWLIDHQVWVRMNEWSVFFVQNGWIQDGRIQDGCYPEVEWEWMSEVFFVQNGWIQDGRIQDGWHLKLSENEWMNEFESEWSEISLSQSFVSIQDGSESKWEEFKMAVSSSLVRINEWS